MDNKRFVIILLIWTAIFTIMGGTLAYWNWQTVNNKNTNVTFTVNRDYTCGADSGGNITSSDVRLAPAKCNDPVYAIKRPITTSVTTTGDKVVSMDLWLNINNISTNLTNTPNFKWAITKNGNTCSGAINHGDFRNIQNNKIDLLSGVDYDDLDDTYYLYIWLDEAETNSNTMNQSFNFSISGKCTDNGLERANLKLNWTSLTNAGINNGTQITDIYFIYDEDLPSGIKESNEGTFDFANSNSKPITAYLINNTDEGADPDTYKLYVSSQYKIYAGNLQSAFLNMSSIKSITFDNFDTSYTTSMYRIFYGCSNLTQLDLSSFNTLNVTNMYQTFFGCTNLTSLNLSGFNTSGVTNMGGMFYSCGSLTELDVSSFNTSSVTHMGGVFQGCGILTELDLSSFNTSNVTNMSGLFKSCNSLTELDLSNFNTSNVTDMSQMFAGCSSLTSLDLSSFNTSNVTNMSSMFNNCYALTSLDLSNFNTTNVTDMGGMFYRCNNLAELDLSSFNTSNVDNMSGMFNGCSALTSLNLSNFNTSNVTNMANMFMYCSGLTSLNLSSFNTTNVTNMGGMFYGCNGLTELDLSNFNTSNVTNMGEMFRVCRNLEHIYVSERWNTDAVTSSGRMFSDDVKLPNYAGSVGDKTNAHYGEGGCLTYKAYNGV